MPALRFFLTLLFAGLLLLPRPSAAQSVHDSSKPFVLSGSVKRSVQAPPPKEAAPQEVGIVGLDMSIRPNRYPLVQQVFHGSPAQRQGVIPGDEILAINGISTLGRSIHDVDALISNVPGTPVRLTLHRFNHMQEVELIVAPLSQISPAARQWID